MPAPSMMIITAMIGTAQPPVAATRSDQNTSTIPSITTVTDSTTSPPIPSPNCLHPAHISVRLDSRDIYMSLTRHIYEGEWFTLLAEPRNLLISSQKQRRGRHG